MGCTNSAAVTPVAKVVNVDTKMINLYIDQLPLIVIQKIKQKFDSYCDNRFQLSLDQFVIMYSVYFKSSTDRNAVSANDTQANIKYTKRILQKLFDFYTDMKQSRFTFKRFIAKYAIINKCQQSLFSNILLFLYSSNRNISTEIAIEDYDTFTKSQRNYFGFQPTKKITSVNQQQFYKSLCQSGFHWEDFRKKFAIIEKQDIPFQSISRGLIQMDINDFLQGQQYYLLSSAWFERWSYYYQGVDTGQDDNNYKSTKLIKKKNTLNNRRGSMQRKSASRKDISFDENTWVIQRPTKISHDEIQGQYRGELKQNIKTNYQIRIISKQIWQMFKKTMPSQSQFKRVANSLNSLDLYPKFVYFLKTDQKGKILDNSFQIIQVSLKKKLKQIVQYRKNQQKDQKKKYYFIKNFGDHIWNQQNEQTALGMSSTNSRFFVVQTKNKDLFIQNYFRKKKQLKNLTYGDKVYSFFTFNKKVMPAYIIRLISQKRVLIHFIDFLYKYEIQADIDSLLIDFQSSSQLKNQSARKLSQINDVFSFKGIQNIGNTCFINSVIQCLIASPIFQQYLKTKKINQVKQPLLYQISELAILLLSNKKASPIKLKKTIDMQLQIFSGNDQHDAQQFLSFLIDKLNRQIKQCQKQEESVLQFLFKGRGQFTLECLGCQALKKIQEQLAIVSLPIPQPQYNTYSMFLFPIYDTKIKKIVLRLHKNSRVIDMISGFQQRIGRNYQDFIFIQCHSGNLKKIRHDFFESKFQNLNLIQAGLTPNIEIHCFQRFRSQQFLQILEQNKKQFKQALYFDYKDQQTEKWFYGKYLQNGQKIQIMNQDNSISTLKSKPNISSSIAVLGSKTKQIVYKKVHQRKYNQILQKMQFFGIHYMIAFPKQVTYYQLQKLIDLTMNNFVEVKESKSKKPYFIKICEFNKQKCLYCNNTDSKLAKKQDLRSCCRLTEQQMHTPIIWIARQKIYSIFIDWVSTQNYNLAFGSVQIDALSLADDKKKNLDKIDVEDCLKLYQRPQNVEMQCEKCKYKQQKRTQIMKYVPHILILHMKQYRITPDMNFCKMDVNIKWIEFLDISNYSVGQKGSIYQLYAYVRHTGTNQSGHYTCAIKKKHPFQNKKIWVNFDDQVTDILDNEQKNIDSAYLLFFKRIDMPNSAFINFTNF